MSGPDFGTTTCARPPALAAGARVLPDAPVTARGVGCATLRERPGSCVNDQVMPAPTDGLRFGDDRQSTRTVSSPTPSGLPGQRGWLGKRLSLAQTSKENKGARSVTLRAPKRKPSDLTRQGRPITGSKTVASEVRHTHAYDRGQRHHLARKTAYRSLRDRRFVGLCRMRLIVVTRIEAVPPPTRSDHFCRVRL